MMTIKPPGYFGFNSRDEMSALMRYYTAYDAALNMDIDDADFQTQDLTKGVKAAQERAAKTSLSELEARATGRDWEAIIELGLRCASICFFCHYWLPAYIRVSFVVSRFQEVHRLRHRYGQESSQRTLGQGTLVFRAQEPETFHSEEQGLRSDCGLLQR